MAESISSMVAWKLRKAIAGTASKDAPRSGTATVQRRDSNGTVWVRLPGASMDTPVVGSVVASVAAGDTISYEIQGGRVNVTGNASDPAAGSRTVRAVRRAAESAAKVASGAQTIAAAIGQHFFTDDNGVHVSSEKDNPTGERNILMNSLGILLRQGSSWLASFSDSAVAFYDGLGNAAANVVAQFGADGAVIGRSGESHMELDYHSMRMIDRDVTEFFEVEDLRDESGYVKETFSGDGSKTSFPLMVDVSEVKSIYVDGQPADSTTDPKAGVRNYRELIVTPAQALGVPIQITYDPVRSEGVKVKAYTLGIRKAGSLTGMMSVVEGYNTLASSSYSHAEGYFTEASGYCSRAAGEVTEAYGDCSCAEGSYSRAHGDCSHAQNKGTVAAYDDQTAIGRYNDNSSGNAFEVGNGVNGYRSNAFAVAWDGTTTHDGDVAWTALTLASGATAYDSDSAPRYRRWGQVVEVAGAVKPAAEVAAGGTLTIGTLPTGCRPPRELDTLCQGSGGNVWLLKVKADGTLEASRYRSGATSIAIPTTAWLTFNCTFIV